MNTIEKFNEHVMQTYGRLNVVMDNGGGVTAHDENGKEYIDFGSGIGVNSLGFCDEKWAEIITTQKFRRTSPKSSAPQQATAGCSSEIPERKPTNALSRLQENIPSTSTEKTLKDTT